MFNRLKLMAITLLMVSSVSANVAEASKLLTADEYYEKGLKDYATMVEKCHKKDFAAGDIMGLMTLDESVIGLSKACMNPERTEQAFPLYQAYMRGAKKALKAYKPHQKFQDAVITFSRNSVDKSLTLSDYATYMKWQQDLAVKATEGMLERTLLLYAEISSD